MITYERKAGSTDVSVVIRIIDSTDGTPETGVVYNSSGIDLQYRREGATSTAITEATLAGLNSAHADGGFLHIGNGYYRLDLPDAAVAAGVPGVLVHGTVTGMVVIGCYVQLVAFDPQSATDLGLSRLDAAITSRASQASLDTLDDYVDTEVGAIKTKTDQLNFTGTDVKATLDGETVTASTVSDKTGYSLSAAGVQAIWDALSSALTTVGSIGKRLVDYVTGDAFTRIGAAGAGLTSLGDTRIGNLDATVSSRATQTSVNTIDDFIDTEVSAIKTVTDKLDTALELDVAVYRFTTNALEQAPSGTGASAAAIADAVWDEAIADHLTAGSTGNKLNAAAAAGDPLNSAVPGAYGAGTAGYIIGTNLNATVSSRASQTSLDTVDDFLDTEVAAIKAKTDNLPADPADASDIAASFAGVNTKLDTIDDFLDTEMAAVKVKTDQLNFTGTDVKATLDGEAVTASSVTDKTGYALTAGEHNSIADAFLVRADGVETGVTPKQALRYLLAFCAGESAGAGTDTIIFRAPDGATARVTLTVNATTGERSAVVLNG